MPKKRGPKTLWMRRAKYQRAKNRKRLKPAQVHGLREADTFARKLGFHLNTFLTVTWSLTHFGDVSFDTEKAPAILKEFRRRVAQWLKARKVHLFWIYVHENRGLNFHTHIMLHIPPVFAAEFEAMAARLAGSISESAVDVQPRNRPGNFQNRLDYMCKGTDPVTARQLRLGPTSDQGEIECKRCGWSENLGQRARMKPGFHAMQSEKL